MMFFATVIPSPSAKTPALGTARFSETTKLVTSPTAKTFSKGVLQSLSIMIKPGSLANPESYIIFYTVNSGTFLTILSPVN